MKVFLCIAIDVFFKNLSYDLPFTVGDNAIITHHTTTVKDSQLVKQEDKLHLL